MHVYYWDCSEDLFLRGLGGDGVILFIVNNPCTFGKTIHTEYDMLMPNFPWCIRNKEIVSHMEVTMRSFV